MLELNKVMLTGRLTRDPDYRSTSTGLAVASFSLAVNRRSFSKDSAAPQEETTFVEVSAWDKQAEFCKNYLRKASGVFVEGRLKQENWQDKESGQNRSKLKVVAERILFAESKADAERHAGSGGGDGSSGDSSGGGSYRSQAIAPRAASNAAPSGGGQRAPEPQYDSGDSGGGGETHDDLPF